MLGGLKVMRERCCGYLLELDNEFMTLVWVDKGCLRILSTRAVY